MSLDHLQTIIDRSLRNASPLTRELFADKRMTAGELQRFVNRVMSGSIATVSPAGCPHASLTLIACSNEGDVYFAANHASVLFRNLQQSASVALTVDDKDHGMMAQGRAELVGRAPDLREELLSELDSLMERGRWLPPDSEGAIYRVALSRVFAQ